jgi:hypothetical protein
MQLPAMGHKREIISSSVGRYAISSTVDAILEHRPWNDRERKLLAGRIAERHRSGEACPVITSYVLEDVLGSTPPEREPPNVA